MLYLTLKWVHVLLAIVAVGANITYAYWIARASRDPDMLPFTLRGIKILDDRIANPAYGLLLLTGVGMVLASGLTFETPWISVSIALFVVTLLVAALLYTPTLRKQIQFAETLGPASPEYEATTRRGRLVGFVLIFLVALITYFMVFKPSLWS